MFDLHSTTQVVSRLHATVLGKSCVVKSAFILLEIKTSPTVVIDEQENADSTTVVNLSTKSIEPDPNNTIAKTEHIETEYVLILPSLERILYQFLNKPLCTFLTK